MFLLTAVLASDGMLNHLSDLEPLKFIAPLLTFIGGIWVSRANIMNAVTKRVNSLLAHLEDEIKRLTTRCIAAEDGCAAARTAHLDCEARVNSMRVEIDALMRGNIAPYSPGAAP